MRLWLPALAGLALAACGAGVSTAPVNSTRVSASRAGQTLGAHPASASSAPRTPPAPPPLKPLPTPANLSPFGSGGTATVAQGVWHPAGRRVQGMSAVYETTLVPPGGSAPAGIAWMDTRLLAARLYSGSSSPGGGPYRYTAPILPSDAQTLVAAFNGGFKMDVAQGGYYTEGRVIDPLRPGAASLVIYADGSVNIGVWGSDVSMTPNVVAVRQNLTPLVAGGTPTPLAASSDWLVWGATCGASSCSSGVPGIEPQWRSAVGVTADGALVYVQGPGLSPLQTAMLLARAGAVRGMELDINPDWPIFATYDPALPQGVATPANGSPLLAGTVQGPGTFFEASWARDFVTMSARTP